MDREVVAVVVVDPLLSYARLEGSGEKLLWDL